MIVDNEIIVANAGDSRAVLAKREGDKIVAKELSFDHKPDNPEEKARIEKAVKSEGAASADWNKNTKILTVTFDPSKTSVDSFSKKLAAVGHDTEKYKADDKAYQALDTCCQYERRK